ncbi:pH-response regulator protein palI/RIM9 [[Candida] railenensis]|uniref:PH-response regulator protein palI/RIM9 n=1 Tax=[Candida] railenensis TaxID=45579 RepID=A0A9P0QU55_9ASCO|nr:pH-response regulator protein palI/RIM9 [[Candida] railenensis]
MHSGLLFMTMLCLGCLVVQLLPILSVPITGKGIKYSIYLSHYDNYKYGVFGLCDVTQDICSDTKIGYPSNGSNFFTAMSEGYKEEYGGVQLPSNARYTISKLLVVHVVSFCFSGCLFLVMLLLMVIYSYENTTKLRLIEKFKPRPKRVTKRIGKFKMKRKGGRGRGRALSKLPQEEENDPPSDGYQDDPPSNNNGTQIVIQEPEARPSKARKNSLTSASESKKRDITPILNLMLMLALLSFMSTLLAFLSDILLFTPHLSYLGWLQFYPIVATSLIASMVCFMKRSITSRKYWEDSKIRYNDDMRIRRTIDLEDSDSDDGFYVYTNGFYSTGDNNEETYHSHRARSTSSHNGWRRHTPRNDESHIQMDEQPHREEQQVVELEDMDLGSDIHRVTL